MKKIINWVLAATLICGSTLSTFALPKVHVIATGGTIAGTSSDSGYDAGQVSIEDILAAVPELNDYAELDYEQFCNIGSQDMDEHIWLLLAKRINQVLLDDSYDAVVVTHGTDTMEETAYFLNLTTHSPKPIVLVGSMRPSDSPEADGPKNLVLAVKTAVDPESTGKEVMCCLGEKIFEAGSVFKNDSHAIDAYAAITPDYYMPHDDNTGFDISKIESLPQVGIIYGYGGCSTLPLQAFMEADFDGVVLAGVGGGNFYAPVQELAEQAVAKGMKIVRSTRCPYGGVYTEGGEVDDLQLGFIAAGCLNPQKARILLMLALTETNDTDRIREYFNQAITTELSRIRRAQSQMNAFKTLHNGEILIQAGDKTYNISGIEQRKGY